jgi:hypothetical protein
MDRKGSEDSENLDGPNETSFRTTFSASFFPDLAQGLTYLPCSVRSQLASHHAKAGPESIRLISQVSPERNS